MLTKPNFLIVGAAKCGTTSLFEYLRKHPDIYMPSCKEVSFYAGRNDAVPISFAEYLRYFKGGKNKKKIGEASAAYLYPEDVAARIADTLGTNIKIIILLRNPVDMSYSLWAHNQRNGTENLPFSEAIAQEKTRLNDIAFKEKSTTWIYNYAYIDRAMYAPQVKRYLDIFGIKNTKIYIFEYFFKHIDDSLSNVCDFLGVDKYVKPDNHTIHNKYGNIRSDKLKYFYSTEHFLTDPIRKITSPNFRKTIINWLAKINSKPGNRQPLEPETKKQLKNLFRTSIHELEDQLDINLKNAWDL